LWMGNMHVTIESKLHGKSTAPPILKVVQREHHRELWMGNMTCGHELSPHEHHRASVPPKTYTTKHKLGCESGSTRLEKTLTSSQNP
jgi:hypothetical protein